MLVAIHKHNTNVVEEYNLIEMITIGKTNQNTNTVEKIAQLI